MKPSKMSKPSPEVELIRTFQPIETTEGEARGYVVEETRGVLHRITIMSMSEQAKRLPHFPDRWAIFEDVCQELRDLLEQHDLPTDKTPLMPEELDVFEERLCDDDVLWHHDVIHSTEPLSQPRLAGELLMALTSLGKREGIENHILEFCSALVRYGDFRVSQVNSLAAAGAAASAGRAAGPAAKSKRRDMIRKIVWRRVEEYWRSFPKFVGVIQGTASAIATGVNADLVAAGLASETNRSIKTIGDDIRAGRDAKVFPDWPIRRRT